MIILVVSTNVRLILSLYRPLSTNNIRLFNSLKIHWISKLLKFTADEMQTRPKGDESELYVVKY